MERKAAGKHSYGRQNRGASVSFLGASNRQRHRDLSAVSTNKDGISNGRGGRGMCWHGEKYKYSSGTGEPERNNR
ncbi:hypothetical protein WN55_04619 [Dufourea novaeangliae]|uniref:Uncharacterized protein n=1 Tax=Dufourea novaeangliae TaxID=178035 RepID=A0A154P161_DUFNO|nr:hypothetical protein WN55_04619 [Dufourea novaeangliae]